MSDVFQVPASKASDPANRFSFRIRPKGKVYSVPLLGYIKPALALSLQGLSELEAAKAVFGEYLPQALGEFDDVEQLLAFFEEWERRSGLTVGESAALPES